MDAAPDGKAFLTIRLDGADTIMIATGNNPLREIDAPSMIAPGTALYATLGEMNIGDRVVFSGTFESSDDDYIADGSGSENGAMSSPRFVMVFTDIAQQE